ncbi:MAG: tetratricopeptide repeat protein [Alphaproteobacteria bacterium]|nr:tetratricopeptide repeat protein [Alphaproteobacteria bacterium]
MATDNNLIREIDEDLQRQRTHDLWKKYGKWIIGGAVLIVLGTASYTSWQAYRLSHDQEATGALFAMLSAPDAKEAAAADKLAAFAAQEKGESQSMLARFYEAEVKKQNKQEAQALEIYESIAADGAADPKYRDLASLLWVQQQLDNGDIEALRTRLGPLAKEGAPWRYSATEYQGLLAVRAGDNQKAAEIFTALSQDPLAPVDLRGRAQDLARYYERR